MQFPCVIYLLITITVIDLYAIVVTFYFNLLYVGTDFTGFAVHSPFIDFGKGNLNTACPVVVVAWSRSAFSL